MPHYYDEKQPSALRPEKIWIKVRGLTFELWSGSGVFSRKALDAGTRLLIEKGIVEPGWRVHDLGCGYGVVGVVMKRSCPSCTVLCSDVSERAIELSRMNTKDLDIEVRKSDGYAKIPEMFDTILFNPPYVAGRETILRLIDEAYAHLVPGGCLQLVARHQKGGKTLKKYLEERFGNCDDSAKGGGFRVYVAKK